MNMSIIRGLESARELIIDKKNWLNRWPNYEDWDKAHFCALTALAKVNKFGYERDILNGFLRKGMQFIDNENYSNMANWNDAHDHEQVIAAFDKAIFFAWQEHGASEVQGLE